MSKLKLGNAETEVCLVAANRETKATSEKSKVEAQANRNLKESLL
jgi:hypothetical protein